MEANDTAGELKIGDEITLIFDENTFVYGEGHGATQLYAMETGKNAHTPPNSRACVFRVVLKYQSAAQRALTKAIKKFQTTEQSSESMTGKPVQLYESSSATDTPKQGPPSLRSLRSIAPSARVRTPGLAISNPTSPTRPLAALIPTGAPSSNTIATPLPPPIQMSANMISSTAGSPTTSDGGSSGTTATSLASLLKTPARLESRTHLALPDSAQVDEALIATLRYRDALERKTNELENQRLQGQSVVYGQTIMLMHVNSGMYLTVSPRDRAWLERDFAQTSLTVRAHEGCWLTVLPGFKVRSEGQPVYIGDTLALFSTKHRQYVHVSAATLSDRVHEINAAPVMSRFRVSPFARPHSDMHQWLKGGDAVTLFHGESEGVLCFDVVNDEMKVFFTSPTDAQHTSGIWVYELSEVLNGGAHAEYTSTGRFRHLGSGEYLSVQKKPGHAARIQCTTQYLSPDTLFVLHPLMDTISKREPNIPANSFVRVQHSNTGLWLNVSGTGFVQDTSAIRNPFGVVKLHSHMDAVFSVKCENNNAIRITTVPQRLVHRMGILHGIIGQLSDFILQLQRREFTAASCSNVLNLIGQTIVLLVEGADPNPWTRTGKPLPDIQVILREQKMMDILMDLVAAPFHGEGALQVDDVHLDEHETLRDCIKLSYLLLRHIITNNTRNALHLTQYFPVMLEQIGQDLNVSDTVTEMFKAHGSLLRHITEEHIDLFIELIQLHGKYPRFVNFLGSLCVQGDVSIPRNQDLICERFVKAHRELLVLVKMDRNTVKACIPVVMNDLYVSSTNFSTLQGSEYWVALLHLFANLCRGRNERNIHTIRELYPFEIVLAQMRNAKLPETLRTAYCELMLYAFIDCAPHERSLRTVGIKAYHDIKSYSVKPSATFSFPSEKEEDALDSSATPASPTSPSTTAANRAAAVPLDDIIAYVIDYIKDHTMLQSTTEKQNHLTLAMLNMFYAMMQLGVMKSTDIRRIAPKALLDALDPKGAGGVVETPSVVQIKLKVTEILNFMLDGFLNVRVNALLSSVKTILDDSDVLPEDATAMMRHRPSVAWSDIDLRKAKVPSLRITPFEHALSQKLLAMANCEDAQLATAAFTLLFRIFNQNTELLAMAERVQVLVAVDTVKAHALLVQLTEQLRQLLGQSLTREDTQQVVEIMRTFTSMCGDTATPRAAIQNILRNIHAHELALELIRRPFDSSLNDLTSETLRFLAVFASGNADNQLILYREMDYLLQLAPVCPAAVDCCTETIRGNFVLANQINDAQIAMLISLIESVGKLPSFLRFLQAVVVVADTPIQHNQEVVAKLLLHKRACLVLAGTAERDQLAQLASIEEHVKFPLTSLVVYHAELIELMAKCCERKSAVVQAQVRNLVSIEDVYMQLTSPAMPLQVKAAFTHLLRHAYMHNHEGIDQNPLVWLIMSTFNQQLAQVAAQYSLRKSLMSNAGPLSVLPAIRRAPDEDAIMTTSGGVVLPHVPLLSSTSPARSDDANVERSSMEAGPADEYSDTETLKSAETEKQAQLHEFRFIVQAMLPAIRRFISVAGYHTLSVPQHADICTGIMDSLCQMLDLVDWASLYPPMVAALYETVVLLKEHKVFARQMAAALPRLARGQSTVEQVKTVQHLYTQEEVLTHTLRSFCEHLRGHEDWRDDFASLLHQLKNDERCAAIMSLVRTCEKFDQGGSFRFPIASMRVLRGVLESETDMKSDQVLGNVLPSTVSVGCAGVDKWQNLLNNAGATNLVCKFISHTNSELAYESMRLGIELLRGGNSAVQQTFHNILQSSRDEAFCEALMQRLIRAGSDVKEARRLLKQLKQRQSHRTFDPSVAMQDIEVGIPVAETCNIFMRGVFKDSGFAEEVLLFLQMLCENHYLDMQSMLRHQRQNIRSFDVISETAIYLQTLDGFLTMALADGLLSPRWATIANQALRTVTDFVQGCEENQRVLCASSAIESASDVLYLPLNPDDPLIMELKSSALVLLQSLLEGNTDTQPVFRMLNVIEFDVLFSEIDAQFQLYKRTQLETDLEYASQAFILTKTILDYGLRETDSIKSRLAAQNFFQYMSVATGRLEISRHGRLETVYFMIPRECRMHWESPALEQSKKDLLYKVNRDSSTHKLQDFIAYGSPLMFEVEHQDKLRKNPVLRMIVRYEQVWKNLALLLAVAINILNVVFWFGPANDLTSAMQNGVPSPLIDAVPKAIIRALGSVHLGCAILMFVAHVMSKVPVIIFAASDERLQRLNLKQASNRQRMQQMEERLLEAEPSQAVRTNLRKFRDEGMGRRWIMIMRQSQIVYLFLYVACSAIGVAWWSLFYAFHLVDIVARNRLLQYALSSVTGSWRSLGLLYLFALVIVNIYSVLGFTLFRNKFWTSNQFVCDSMLMCFTSLLNLGFRNDGVGSIMITPDPQQIGDWYTLGEIVYQESHHLIIFLFIFGIFTGVIIDTFAQLRDQKNRIETDMRERCFVCSLDRHLFDRHTIGFEHHIMHHHNMWQYLFFGLYMKRKPSGEFSGQESFVSESLGKEDISFFPINQAMSLSRAEREQTGSEETSDVVREVLRQVQDLKTDLLQDKVIGGRRVADANAAASADRLDSIAHALTALTSKVDIINTRVSKPRDSTGTAATGAVPSMSIHTATRSASRMKQLLTGVRTRVTPESPSQSRRKAQGSVAAAAAQQAMQQGVLEGAATPESPTMDQQRQAFMSGGSAMSRQGTMGISSRRRRPSLMPRTSMHGTSSGSDGFERAVEMARSEAEAELLGTDLIEENRRTDSEPRFFD